MSKVTINKVNVKSFANLKDKTFELNGENTAFVGNNRLGKTNMLNAIHWCLTGYDLDNNYNITLFVPYDDYVNANDGDVVIDVTVELSCGKIRRYTKFKGESLSTSIEINDVECKTLKDAEIKIDTLLGILKLTINQIKDFNVRRLLLNPIYVKNVKESAFRQFIVSQLQDEINYKEIYLTLPTIVRRKLSAYVDYDYDVANISNRIAADIKSTKANIEYWKIVKDYLETYLPDAKEIKDAENRVTKFKEDLALLNETKVALDKFALEVNRKYDEVCSKRFDGITVKMLEKGVGEDVYKEVCKPILENGLTIDFGSTSEQIGCGIKFINGFIKTCAEFETLPILFDECETFDDNSIKEITNKIDAQLVTAKVKSGIEQLEKENI